MLTDLFTAVSIGFFLSFVLGPVFFVLIETSITKGLKAAISLNLGVILADVFFIVFCYYTSKQLMDNINNQPGLFVLGGAILSVYGGYIFLQRNKTDKKIELKDSSVGYFGLFIKGFALNIINMAVLLFTTIIASYFLTDLLKIIVAKKLSSKINTKNTSFIKSILSLILLISGTVLIIKGSL
jgi:threonine/homoserine/homoserine lactone efflux protein